jgi:hypothetical protein
MKKSPRLPLWQSIFWIVGSALFVSGASHKTIQYYFIKKPKMEPVVENTVSYIVQTGLQKEALHSDYLAELMDLSADKPTLYAEFDEEKAQEKLLASPLFQEAKVKKVSPNTVYVDYAIRKPVGWVLDFVNTVLDKEGHLFPMAPYFSPKKLPEIYLGQEGIHDACLNETPSFQTPLKGKYLDLALKVLSLFNEVEKDFFRVQRVDVSQAFWKTLGKRGIVVTIENQLSEPEATSIHFLRLSTLNFAKEIANYLNLRESLLEAEKEKVLMGEHLKERIIDLRISQLAFVE